MAVNDAFVMTAWGKDRNASDIMRMLSDGNGDLVRAMGLELDASGFGMGKRSKRFAVIVDDGVVKYLGVEPAGEVGVSSADAVLAAL
jgi:peroxiredoxin